MILPAPAQKRIVLAGRAFVPVGESTVEHDLEVMRLVRAAGLEGLDASTGDEFAYAALGAFVAAGTLPALVACLILPEEHAPRRPGGLARLLERAGIVRRAATRGGWSPEVQMETAAFLRQLDDPADKNQFYGLVALLLVPFLNGALRSWLPSPRSSGSPDAAASHDGTSGLSAAETWANGAGSFASSPDTTRSDTPG